MKRALITGIMGQDGSYLAELLRSKDYQVFGLLGDLTDDQALEVAVNEAQPDEVYNLGGITDLKTAYESPEKTRAVNYRAVGVLLEAALRVNKKVRFLQASSSEIFLPSASPLNEDSPRDWATKNPYAEAKLLTDRDFIETARKENNFACSAIMFSHESPRRTEKAVLRKISSTLVKIKLGQEKYLELGNLEPKRDWGYAGDYVIAMWLMLQLKEPEDFVIATGQVYKIKEAVGLACRLLGLDPERVIKINPELYRPAELYPKVGDITKAKRILDWQPTVPFPELIKMMVEAELTERASKSDKTFPQQYQS